MWRTLRRTDTDLHVTYGNTFSNNLSAQNVKVRTDPHFELALDLNGNLRKRNKQVNTYQDARELADGAIEHLKFVQIHDERIVERIAQTLESLGDPPPSWILTIELEGSHSFQVRPKALENGNLTCLELHVESEDEEGV